MTVCIGDVRAKDDGIKKRIRRLFAFVKPKLFSCVLYHASEERFSRTAVCAIEYQYPFLRLPAVLLTTDRVDSLEWRLTFPLTPYPGQQTT